MGYRWYLRMFFPPLEWLKEKILDFAHRLFRRE